MADLLHKVAPTFALAIAIYTYFHTIRPVFLKEDELAKTKQVVSEQQQRLQSMSGTIGFQQQQLKEFVDQIEFWRHSTVDLQSNAETLRKEKWTLEDRLRKSNETREAAQLKAISAELWRLVDRVVTDRLVRSLALDKRPLDLRKRAIEVADQALKSNEPGEYENVAALLFKTYAEKKLREGETDTSPLFGAITYALFDQEAKNIVRQAIHEKE